MRLSLHQSFRQKLFSIGIDKLVHYNLKTSPSCDGFHIYYYRCWIALRSGMFLGPSRHPSHAAVHRLVLEPDRCFSTPFNAVGFRKLSSPRVRDIIRRIFQMSVPGRLFTTRPQNERRKDFQVPEIFSSESSRGQAVDAAYQRGRLPERSVSPSNLPEVRSREAVHHASVAVSRLPRNELSSEKVRPFIADRPNKLLN